VQVTVVVVNWNRGKLLKACLDSLAAQRHPAFEVIVVDNGSHDGSVEMIQKLRDTFPVPLHLITNLHNLGFCAANNQAITRSEAQFIALLNNDAEAEPDWLGELERVIRTSDDVGMAASKILVWEDPLRIDPLRIDPPRIDKVGHLIFPDGQNRGRGTGEIDHGQYDRVEETLWPDGCAAMYRRAMLDEIGGFDEDFFAYADDAELGLRGRIAGWRCLVAPGAVVRHHRGASLGLGSARRLTLIERNRVLLAVKLFPWNLLWLNGAYFGIRIAGGMWAAIRNRGELRRYSGTSGKFSAAMALMWGTLSAIPLIPKMLKKRRAFRAKHKLTPKQVRALLMRHRISLREISEQAT
jgi:GT2 family glycosyltransferase